MPETVGRLLFPQHPEAYIIISRDAFDYMYKNSLSMISMFSRYGNAVLEKADYMYAYSYYIDYICRGAFRTKLAEGFSRYVFQFRYEFSENFFYSIDLFTLNVSILFDLFRKHPVLINPIKIRKQLNIEFPFKLMITEFDVSYDLYNPHVSVLITYICVDENIPSSERYSLKVSIGMFACNAYKTRLKKDIILPVPKFIILTPQALYDRYKENFELSFVNLVC